MSDGDVVATLMAMTSCSEEEAVGYLACANFDLATAHSLYVAEHEHPPARPPAPPPPPPPPARQGASSPSGTSAAGSPGYTTPPYLISRLDGGVGARQEPYSTASLGRQGPLRPSNMRFPPPFDADADPDSTLPFFVAPPFVHQGGTSFSHFCERALECDRWVLLSLIGDSFSSVCVNRDVWRYEGASGTLEMFSIYQINASSERGEQLAHGYRIDVLRDLPTLLIINPLTTMKESRVPLNMKGIAIDVSEVNEALLSFLGERGSPSQWEERKLATRGTGAVPFKCFGSPIVVEDDADDTPEIVASQPANAATEPPIEVIDISQYQVDEGEKHAFSLRCRLPKGQMTLRLKPETPAYLLLEYLAYRAYQDQPEAYPQGVPKCSLKTGYPPREVNVKSRGVQLGTWDDVHSGDTVFLHIQ
ncbi:UBX domain-containing protein [Trypanosoma cruzi]|uniref:UBX domain-containing protein n=2 Tax=Trypanosoma cruzi TaxID=5693 RepID=Q4DAT4_TRYCC|nr:hypothetical protein, conserved [Trypanosoma cruzi]EAN89630.1 hypothetical protein, conserved [Trypanosoma cruzi]KAF5221462.1 UBX domain-containing protein [Trypanosoma cruzi]KAF8293199.1 UBX domain-containing protein [Trypanosoma cruzi]PWV07943.1 UBX domain-containing protein [Trypanosoma cruzi]RNC59605.1 UBX domain protein 7 [Trypanosoma cruzi]|eukprot:XP_811481.1 hypothetical protein [Trypanosoma cruzi strain CL Brener]